MDAEPSQDAARHVYEEWHRATLAKDLDALGALYALNAVFETPGALLSSGDGRGVVIGREAIKGYLAHFFEKMGGNIGLWYRTDVWFTNGKQLMWEYPRQTPRGDQAEILEVMELDDEGLIAVHRVYWGWSGVKNLLELRNGG